METRRPLVVYEGLVGEEDVGCCLRDLERAGWTVVEGWAAPLVAERVVCAGRVRTPDDARRALLSALVGAGLVVTWEADSITRDRFLDDLRRLGAVEHVLAPWPDAAEPAGCTMPAWDRGATQTGATVTNPSRIARSRPRWRT